MAGVVPDPDHRAAICTSTVPDSFEFAEKIRGSSLQDKFMCSFDVASLFTNVPLRETVDIIEFLISDLNLCMPVPTLELKSLLLLCTQNVQFSFDHKLYTQVDGVAMGSPLGPILADIFLGYLERYLLKPALRRSSHQPCTFFRYVDDTFAVFLA